MSPPSPTTLEHALLGLVRMSPMSGYDVKKIFESTSMRQFSSSPGAIYPALKRLVTRGLLSDRLDTTTPARPRRVFSITDEGLEALRGWVSRPVSQEELMRDRDVPILRFNLSEGVLSRAEVITFLEDFGREVTRHLGELDRQKQMLAGIPLVHPGLSLQNGIRSFEALRDWVGDAIAALEAGK